LIFDPLKARTNPIFIRRASQDPVIDCNLTLPWVLYRETIIAPTSITGGGIFITLNGTGNTAKATEVFTSLSNDRKYGVGDVIDLNVRFSVPVTVAPVDTFLRLKGFSRPVNYYYMLDPYTLVFPLVVREGDFTNTLTYENVYALQASGSLASCKIVETSTGLCVATNLPIPDTTSYIATSYSAISSANPFMGDLLTPKGIQISTDSTRPIAIHFLPSETR
jgi:hypothetical protein